MRMKRKRRILSLLLAALLVFAQVGSVAYAEGNGIDTGIDTGGLCKHHPEHTADCGYSEGTAETPCTHEHGAECYETVEQCVHEHTDECYTETDENRSGGATPSDAKQDETMECPHVCSEEDGCITEVLNCSHEHDGECGYAEAVNGNPCGYVCSECGKEPEIGSGITPEPEKETCTCTERCSAEQVNEECPVCKADAENCVAPEKNNGLVIEISGWEWIDLDGYLNDGVLPVNNPGDGTQLTFEGVVSMLPTQVSAVIKGESEIIELDGWQCGTFNQDTDGKWPVTGTHIFTAKLPENYSLTSEAAALTVTVKLPEEPVKLLANTGTGDFTVTGGLLGTDYSYTNNTLTILTGEAITISGSTRQDKIVIAGGVTANITLNNVEIVFDDGTDRNKPGTCAFDMAGAAVNLTLEGKNTLKSGRCRAGLHVPAGAALTIVSESTGSLSAECTEWGGAGIGGHRSEAAGEITIEGGTVNAFATGGGAAIGGGNWEDVGDRSNPGGGKIIISGGTVTANSHFGAGIGGGQYSSGDEVIISGGTVTATGGSRGAGIGGGSDGSGGSIKISGGTVTATGGSLGAGIGGGSRGSGGSIKISGGTVRATGGGSAAGIGGGSGGDNGSFSTGNSGNAMIFTNSISDKTEIDNWSCIIFEGDTVKVYGSPALSDDVEVPEAYKLTVPSGSTLTITSGVTLTNRGIISVENGGDITNQGLIRNYGTIENWAINGSVLESSSVTVTFALKQTENSYKENITTANYEDTIKIIATAKNKTGTARTRGAAADTVDFYLEAVEDSKKLGTADIIRDDTTVTATLELILTSDIWTEKGFAFGNNTIIADFGGASGLQLLDSTGEADLKLERKMRTISAPGVKNIANTGVILTEASLSEGEGTILYGYSTTKDVLPSRWQQSLEVTGLTPETTYYFYAKAPRSDYYEEAVSPYLKVNTLSPLVLPETVLCLNDGNIRVTGAGNNDLSVEQGTAVYRVSDSQSIRITGSNEITSNTIAVVDADAKIILEDIKQGGGEWDSPIMVGGRNEASKANLTLILEGHNVLASYGRYINPGIFVGFGSILTIEGPGSLTIGNENTDMTIGIGGFYSPPFSQVIINGGTLDITAVCNAIGMLTDIREGAPSITINGGIIKATITGGYGAGIGVSEDYDAINMDIAITGGSVELSGAGNGIGINGELTITGGSVDAASMNPAPTNGSVPVFRGTVDMGKAGTVDAFWLKETDYGPPARTDEQGGMTLYLPEGDYEGKAVIDGDLISFNLSVKADDSGGSAAENTGIHIQTSGGTKPEITEEGGILLPPGSEVVKDGKTVQLSSGGKLSDNGSITGGEIQIGNTVFTGEGTTVTPEGIVIIPDGGSMKIGAGPVIVLGPGNGGEVDEEGNVEVLAGGKVRIGNDPTTTVTLPNGGKVKPNVDGSVSVPGGTIVQIGEGKTFTIPEEGGKVNDTVTVTFDSRGGSAVDSQKVIVGGKAAKPADTAQSGYIFDGWYKEADCITPWDFDTDMVIGNITLYAKWIQDKSGDDNTGDNVDDSSDDNSDDYNPPAPPSTQPQSTGVITIGSPDKDGNVEISMGQVTDAINQAFADARKNGTAQNGVAVAAKLAAGTTGVSLPREALDKLIASGVKDFQFNFGGMTMSFDSAALKEIGAQSSGTVSFGAVKAAGLIGDALAAIGSRPSYSLSVNWQKDGKREEVTRFGGGRVTLELAYTPAEGEHTGGLYLVRAEQSGSVVWFNHSSYDSGAKRVIGDTSRFSVYGVGYKAPPAFTDTVNHWAKDDIDFAAVRGLLSGTSDTVFTPDAAVTRGMFVTALGRLAGINPDSYPTRSFSDVEAGSGYAAYVEWAAKQNIVKGEGEGLFSPDGPVTREQMAVILADYARQTDGPIPAKLNEDGNRFDPQGIVTRAEAAAELRRYVELVLDL